MIWSLLPARVTAMASWILRCAIVWCAKVTVRIVRAIRRIGVQRFETIICIESGSVGFTLLEIRELYRSAVERYGLSSVARSVVADRRRYLFNARASIRASLPRYYWVDPRSGSQKSRRAVLQSLGLTVLLAWYGITPIVWLADLPHRRMRLQAEILAAGRGVVLVMEDPRESPIRLAHENFRGPMPMPLSRETFDGLRGLRTASAAGNPSAIVVGSLYEPRISIVRRVQDSLRTRGHELEVHARPVAGVRVPDSEYWRRLASAAVVFTTADHSIDDEVDRVDSPHLVYRYTEALAAGAPLVAPVIRTARHLYEPGVHYAGYETEAEAIDLIAELLEDPARREELAEAGRRQVERILDEAPMWGIIERLRS